MIAFPNKKYNIIYADPPYSYRDKRNTPTKNNPNGAGGAIKHYKTMKIDEICDLNIEKISDKNCMLFLWATSPLLPEAFKVMNSWDFTYKTCGFVWIKTTNDMKRIREDGIGNYTTQNAEFCLIGLKGKYWRKSTKLKQVVLSPKTKHSQKPKQVRDKIVELLGDLPRIELFAREKAEGWDVWGNEI